MKKMCYDNKIEYDDFHLMIEDIEFYIETNPGQINKYYNKTKTTTEFGFIHVETNKIWYMVRLYKMVDQIKSIRYSNIYNFNFFTYYDYQKILKYPEITKNFIIEFAGKINYKELLYCYDAPEDIKDYCRMFL
jgi:hypothetical protein